MTRPGARRFVLLAALLLAPLAVPAAEETPLERLLATGLALERDFEFRRAEAVYEEALRRADETTDVLLALARVAEAVNDIPGARARYAEVARQSPGRPEPSAGAGWLAVKLDRRAEAKRHFLDALDKDPRYAPACAGLAFAAIEDGDFKAADRWLDRAEQESPDVEAVLAARSEWLFRRGDMTGSTLLLRRLRKLYPSHLGAMQRLANGYAERDRAPYFRPRFRRTTTGSCGAPPTCTGRCASTRWRRCSRRSIATRRRTGGPPSTAGSRASARATRAGPSTSSGAPPASSPGTRGS